VRTGRFCIVEVPTSAITKAATITNSSRGNVEPTPTNGRDVAPKYGLHAFFPMPPRGGAPVSSNVHAGRQSPGEMHGADPCHTATPSLRHGCPSLP